MKPKAHCLFEASWEVCNKVGGIYTVVSSKAPQMVKAYKEGFYLVGPYFKDKAELEFQPTEPNKDVKKVFQELEKEGIIAHHGTWLIKGRPNTILLDYSKFFETNKDKIKAELWESFGIDSLSSSSEFDGPIVWATALGKLLESASKHCDSKKIVGQFHEWLAGAGILYLKRKKIKIATVFTTHATVLGRAMSGNNRDLYGELGKFNPDEEAVKSGVNDKYQIEKASAQQADIFTTVSEITGMEAEHILGRKPEVLVPNGLDFDKLPNLEEVPIKHRVHKNKMKEFVRSFFFPYYSFDDDNTLFYYISGRYEFRNKGLDVTIQALAKLNEKFKKEERKQTIVVFIFIPGNVKTIKLQILENKSLFEDIQDSIDVALPDIRRKIIDSFVHKKMPVKAQLFDDDFLVDFRRGMISFKKKGDPPLCTHELWDENDAILTGLRENGLLNREEDRVKVIFYPGYLAPSDRLLDMAYYPAIWACHLGIFPSYYEPWGYTPLESAAHGVPAITSDLAGFGRFVVSKGDPSTGIFVVKRYGQSDDAVVKQLSDTLYWYSTLKKKERIAQKIKAEHFAQTLDWSELVDHYIKAQNMAFDKVK